MPKKTSPFPINQTAIGNDNIQVVGSNNIINRITNFFVGDTEQQRAKRNRRAMLELVENIWIKGVLEKSLYNELLIELGMEERPGAVDHPWDMQVQMPNKENRTLPAGTSVIEVFDEMNGAMLILGEPGSGKTTMMLELARDCISRARQDEDQPIPVIFNLSSWSDNQTIDDWLVNELNAKYNIPKKTALSWVINDDLQLLLDGLDEVRSENQGACVKGINDFRQKHGLTMPIAVCSRIADYETLTTKLNLSGAILLQPLTPRQIDEYFERAGSELKQVYQILKNDQMLQELVKQPLMLGIATLAYRGVPVDTFTGEIVGKYEFGTVEIGTKEVQGKRLQVIRAGRIEIRRKLLLNTYIQQMFERVARTKNELYPLEHTKHWLAWLARKMLRRGQSIFLLERIQRNWLQTRTQIVLQVFMIPVVIGLIISIFWGVLIALMVCAVLAWIALLSERPTELLRWSWTRAWSGLTRGLKLGLRAGLISWPIVVLVVWQNGWGTSPLLLLVLPILATIFMLSMIAGLFGWVFGGIETTEMKLRTVPNQGIQQSMKNAIIVDLLVTLVIGLTIGLDLGIYIGLVSGLYLGGFAVISHYLLRFIFYCKGYMPWDYVRFLDYCVDRIFLRRVGGGYIFIHRLLMEHFAAMYPADEK